MSLSLLLDGLLGSGYTQPTQPQQPIPPEVIPAVDQTQSPPSQTSPSQTATNQTNPNWPGQLPPPQDNGGVRFDFSEPLSDATNPDTTNPDATEPDPTAQAATTAPMGGGNGGINGGGQNDAGAKSVSITGTTMVRLQNDEDRLRAWAISMLQQERRSALPLSLVTDATAAPPAQAGSASRAVVPFAAANTDLAAAPAKLLARA